MDAQGRYAEIVREAAVESARARQAYDRADGDPAALGSVTDGLAAKARELGGRLREVLPELEGASSCAVTVSFPPSIDVVLILSPEPSSPGVPTFG